MRMSLLAAWAILPSGAWAYHEGPGQDQMALDQVDAVLREAHDYACDQQWASAIESYEKALKDLPKGNDVDSWRIRLERDKAQMLAKQLPQAHADLKQLVEDLLNDEKAEPALLAEARSTLANAQYYMTWLMRLEGAGREDWEPRIEAARQTLKLLAEEARKDGDREGVSKFREDLEAAVRLARMDLTELQGIPLPSQ